MTRQFECIEGMCYRGQHLTAYGIILSDHYCLSLLLFQFTVSQGPCILDRCIPLDIFNNVLEIVCLGLEK